MLAGATAEYGDGRSIQIERPRATPRCQLAYGVAANARASADDLRARLAALDAEPRTTALDPVAVRQQLKGYLRDWQGLLLGHLGQAQQVLRWLVVGRLTFTPQKGGFYAFAGTGTVRPLPTGTSAGSYPSPCNRG